MISVIVYKMGKHSDFRLSFFQIEVTWRDFTVVTKLMKNFKSLYGFGGRCLKIRDVCMNFEPNFKVHNFVAIHPKSIKRGQMTKLNMIFHVVVSVYRLVKIWNSPQFPAEFRNGLLLEILRWKNSWSPAKHTQGHYGIKCLHGLPPDYLASKKSEQNTNYNLMDSEKKLNARLPCTNYFKASFSYSDTALWNRLPYGARYAESLRLFKREINKAP